MTGEPVAEGMIRVYARANVLGLKAESWGDVPKTIKGLETLLRRGMVQIEGPNGEAIPAEMPPPRPCGCGR